MTVEALKTEFKKLTPADRSSLVDWIAAQNDDDWDAQIIADHQAGKLDQLIDRAKAELNAGTIREAP